MPDPFISVALLGDLNQYFKEELEIERRAVTDGIVETAEDLKFDLRQDVVSGGLGQRIARSWRAKHYPGRNQHSLGAASEVFTKAPKLVRAFDEGVTIKSNDGFFLAIPTDAAPKKGTDRKRINPSNFPENRFGPLRFIYRDTGPSLLVVENQRKTKAGRYALSRSKRALKTGYGLSTVVMFTLLPQVKLKRRLNVGRITSSTPRDVTNNIDKAFRSYDAARGRK